MTSLLSAACHSCIGQPDITPGNQAVRSRACFSLWVCSCSTCPGRQNRSAEPDTLQGSFPAARLPGVWAWEVVPPPSLRNWPSLPGSPCTPGRAEHKQFPLGTPSWNAWGTSLIWDPYAICSLRITDSEKKPCGLHRA